MWLRRKKTAPSRTKAIKTLVLHFEATSKNASLRDDFLSFVRATSDNVIVHGEDRPIEVGSSSQNTRPLPSLASSAPSTPAPSTPFPTSSTSSLSSDSSSFEYPSSSSSHSFPSSPSINPSTSHFPSSTGLQNSLFTNFGTNDSNTRSTSEDNSLTYDPSSEFPPLEVIVELKNIKRIYLRVIPPEGTVKVSAPFRISSQTIRRFIEKEREWINNAQKKIYERNRLFAAEDNGNLNNNDLLTPLTEGELSSTSNGIQQFPLLQNLSGNSEENIKRKNALLKEHVETHIDRWIRIVGKEPTHISYRVMKTRWGSCTPSTGRIRLNTALTSLNNALIEYVVIHELVHLHAPGHGPLFREHMDRCLPNWRQLRAQLNHYSRTHSI